ncbi:unannotated protein [freshwater metagenome]|uniref:Unannotated protein n=1 Tax=freshwater metagenome TaxID=449393 RepID=A0A6J7GZ27_9ZZZZ
MHEACCTVAQQGAHVYACAIVGKALLEIFASRLAAIWRTAFPVANTVGKTQRTPNKQHWDDGVKRNLQCTRNALEHFTMHERCFFPASDLGDDARDHGEDTNANSERNRDLIWLDALCAGHRGGCRVVCGAHEDLTLVGFVPLTENQKEFIQQLLGAKRHPRLRQWRPHRPCSPPTSRPWSP